MPGSWCSASGAEQTETLYIFLFWNLNKTLLCFACAGLPPLCLQGRTTHTLRSLGVCEHPFRSAHSPRPRAPQSFKLLSLSRSLWFLAFSLLFSFSSRSSLGLWTFSSRFFLKWVLKLDSSLTRPSFQIGFYYNYLIGHCLCASESSLILYPLSPISTAEFSEVKDDVS